MNAFDIPDLTYADVKQAAQEFLATYHPTLELPIPIEDIIDVKLGLHIFPFPRLYKDFHLNGFLSHDRTTINVDETQYIQFYPKYRYTLAHELGHYILHRACYEQILFASPDEFVKWKLSVPPEDFSWFETHADWFAGNVLVPVVPLKAACIQIIEKYRAHFSTFPKIPDDFWSYASNELSELFEVSPITVEIQIRKERLAEELRKMWNES